LLELEERQTIRKLKNFVKRSKGHGRGTPPKKERGSKKRIEGEIGPFLVSGPGGTARDSWEVAGYKEREIPTPEKRRPRK